jgi:murein DD-endopeptidase MepM/ murein hydrolase activator NlpD
MNKIVSKLLLILVLFCISCTAERYITHYERERYINQLERKINRITDTKYGRLILKYDLLELGPRRHGCVVSDLYKSITEVGIPYDEYIYNIQKIENDIEKYGKNKKLLHHLTKEKIKQLRKTASQTIINKSVKQVSAPKDQNLNKYLQELEEISHIIDPLPLITPLPSSVVTSNFGIRKDPFSKKRVKHSGIDFKGIKHAKVRVPADGIVRFAAPNGSYGNLIIIDHGNGFSTRYGHLNHILVHKGEHVYIGQAIGIQGKTGKATAEHLHYEIRYKEQPLDPAVFLKLGKGC